MLVIAEGNGFVRFWNFGWFGFEPNQLIVLLNLNKKNEGTRINMYLKSLNNNYINSHRNHMNRIFYKNIFKSLDLCVHRTHPVNYFASLGILCMRDAGFRGNKTKSLKHPWKIVPESQVLAPFTNSKTTNKAGGKARKMPNSLIQPYVK